MKRLALIFFLFLPTLLLAYTSPSKPIGFVNDFAKMLKPETVSSLEATLTNFSQQTGNEISIVTIPTHGNDETIETYAEKLFQEWKIGKAKEDNGLLLLISRDDHEMRIEVGYGLEPVITDIESGRIIREVLTPAFKDGKYDEGIVAAVNRLTSDITNGSAPVVADKNLQFNDIFNPLVASLFFFIYFGSILARSKSWWAGGIIGGILGWLYFGGITIIFALVIVGLLFDYFVSRAYKNSKESGTTLPWWIGGGGMGGGKGGGFGGFGGGMSGGGGASGRW